MQTVIPVLVGSQTGNSIDVATRLSRQAYRKNVRMMIYTMDTFPLSDLLNYETIIFICSTTGQGEEPENMKQFWKFLLKKSLPDDLFSQWRFAILGLGDSSYEKFNAVAKRLSKRLMQLGAQMICEMGQGDDQHPLGMEYGVSKWIDELFPCLAQCLNFTLETRIHEQFDIMFEFLPVEELKPIENDFIQMSIEENKRLTQKDHFQDIRLIKLKSPNYPKSSDVLKIKPQMCCDEVDQLIERMKWNDFADKKFMLVPSKCFSYPFHPLINAQTTIRKLLIEELDIHSTPRQSFFERISHFTNDVTHKERLQYFSSKEGLDEWIDYSIRPRKTPLEIFTDFDTIFLPFNSIIDVFPLIQTKSFSIARQQDDVTELLIGIVEYQNKYRQKRQGTLSRWIQNLYSGQLLALPSRSSFSLPRDPMLPVILIGCGTGIAPLRSFLHNRCSHDEIGDQETLLFYGTRYKEKDFLFQDEWAQFNAKFKCFEIVTAFSREQKIYVQDLIRGPYRDRVIRMISENCYCIVVGNKLLPQAIKSCFEEILGIEKVQEIIKNKFFVWESW